MEDLIPFGVGGFVSLIAKISLEMWGNKIILECLYDPLERKPYKMIFFNCTEINWSLNRFENVDDNEADLIDIQLGEEQHKKPAIIYTDIFELSILYGSFTVEKDW